MNILYQILSTAFCTVIIAANVVSSKIVKLPFFDDFSIPVGLLFYPLTFLISDLVTEIFGAQKAKLMVYIAFGMSALSYSVIQIALWLPTPTVAEQQMFRAVLGLNGIILVASLLAYIVSQIVDIQLYAWIKKATRSRFLWLRNNVSTLIAQVFDTAIVNTIHLHFGLGMEMAQVAPIMLFSYTYKATFNMALTPLFYFCVFSVKRLFLRAETSPGG